METPRIYAGTYAKYNNGDLTGKWLDLTDYSDYDEFIEACQELHNDEEDPELMFQDYENIPECFISESHISAKFWVYIEAMEDLSDDEQEAFRVYMDNYGYDMEESEDYISSFQDAYNGYYDGHNPRLDFAERLFDECYLHEVPKSVRYYIDYEKFERDLFIGDYWEQDGYVFRNN